MIQQKVTEEGAAEGRMELSILTLGSPRRRLRHFSFDFENGSNPSTPPSAKDAPVSPFARSSGEDDDEVVSEQHQAAIPFVWEEKPGTPRGVNVAKTQLKIPTGGGGGEGKAGLENEESGAFLPLTRGSSPRETEVDNSSPPPNSDFRFQSSKETTAGDKSSRNCETSKKADERFSQGKIIPLKPPPRLQSVKQLIAADAAAEEGAFSSGSRTPGQSFRKDGLRTPTRSFRKDGLKALIAPSPRREKPGEPVTTMLGFEEWPPKDESRKNGQGHRRSSSLSKLPTLFRRKHNSGKENGFGVFDGNESGRKSRFADGSADRRPFDCLSSRTLTSGRDDLFESSQNRRFDIDARSDYFSTSGRTILEEDPEDREDGDEEVVEVETASNKQHSRLSRFFTKKPSRLSAVAPSPSPEDIEVKSVSQTSHILKMCLSNGFGFGQALVRGVKYLRSTDSQSQEALPEFYQLT
ncbi:hypothetical protein R1sor_005663 [Riccia sorocarpa]|uniref:Uncharacterized protein n=1 Tax=Riccia sorocarpa TaxID=122646 RepID=A0ABD3HKG7_9MARC